MNHCFRIDFHFSQVSSPANPVNLVWKLCMNGREDFPRPGFSSKCGPFGPEFGHHGCDRKLIMGR
jgi:hypothetical protein